MIVPVGLSVSRVLIIQHPFQFYQSILSKIASARHQITLGSLYLGSSEIEIVISICKLTIR